jgi:hypothetical protein
MGRLLGQTPRMPMDETTRTGLRDRTGSHRNIRISGGFSSTGTVAGAK